jgi:uncharacterized membrane protein
VAPAKAETGKAIEQKSILRPGQAREVLDGGGLVSGQVVQHFEHSGPLPSPQVLAGYNQALPGAADRIIQMAEREQTHRHALQEHVSRTRIWAVFVGMGMAFTIGIVGMVLGYMLLSAGKQLAGFTAFLVPLAALVGVYFHDRDRRVKPVQSEQASASQETSPKEGENKSQGRRSSKEP